MAGKFVMHQSSRLNPDHIVSAGAAAESGGRAMTQNPVE